MCCSRNRLRPNKTSQCSASMSSSANAADRLHRCVPPPTPQDTDGRFPDEPGRAHRGPPEGPGERRRARMPSSGVLWVSLLIGRVSLPPIRRGHEGTLHVV